MSFQDPKPTFSVVTHEKSRHISKNYYLGKGFVPVLRVLSGVSEVATYTNLHNLPKCVIDRALFTNNILYRLSRQSVELFSLLDQDWSVPRIVVIYVVAAAVGAVVAAGRCGVQARGCVRQLPYLL